MIFFYGCYCMIYILSFVLQLSSKILLLQRLLELDGENDELSGGLWKICDPFEGAPSYSYVPDKCPKDAIPIGDLPIVSVLQYCDNQNKYHRLFAL